MPQEDTSTISQPDFSLCMTENLWRLHLPSSNPEEITNSNYNFVCIGYLSTIS